MLKRIFSFLGLVILVILMSGMLTAAAPMPNVTFTLLSGLPETMNVGDTATVVIEVTSDLPFNYAAALPDVFFPGRGVVAHGGDRQPGGTSAVLEVTFTAKGSTAEFGGGVPVSVVAGARYKGGVTVSETFPFTVTVP